ncbi:hypothetical protein [Xanthocytophaga agilis]|uniref:Uncharacterized protein n=1 Tax=Xanthocytophaga agilis TaxID=3048010 RepID=A0AAE3R008_9BACT|nr:hypothetical protein [Xanthocytophaga agilis]MDJ1499107.1 hypothetical protein [Xanthocytophaga agilis]
MSADKYFHNTDEFDFYKDFFDEDTEARVAFKLGMYEVLHNLPKYKDILPTNVYSAYKAGSLANKDIEKLKDEVDSILKLYKYEN